MGPGHVDKRVERGHQNHTADPAVCSYVHGHSRTETAPHEHNM